MKGKELDAFLKTFADAKHPTFADIFVTTVAEKHETQKKNVEAVLHYGDVCVKLQLPLKGDRNNQAFSRGLNGKESQRVAFARKGAHVPRTSVKKGL